jgi:hypothetical protein
MSNGGAHDGRTSRRGLLKAGLAAAAVAGAGAWRAAPAGPARRMGLRRPGRSRTRSFRRDANASGLLDMIDLRRPVFAHPPPLARPLLDTHPGALACNVTGPGTIPPPGSVSPPPGPATTPGPAAAPHV